MRSRDKLLTLQQTTVVLEFPWAIERNSCHVWGQSDKYLCMLCVYSTFYTHSNVMAGTFQMNIKGCPDLLTTRWLNKMIKPVFMLFLFSLCSLSYTFTAGTLHACRLFTSPAGARLLRLKHFVGMDAFRWCHVVFLKLQPKLEFYNMNVFKCFAYPVCWFTVQGFTCLQIKRGHTGPKSCFSGPFCVWGAATA